MNVPDVKVNHVELRRRLRDAFDLQDVPRRMVDAARVKAQRTRADRDQRRTAYGVATREECHLMSELHELVVQGDDTTRSVPPYDAGGTLSNSRRQLERFARGLDQNAITTPACRLQ